MSEIVKSPFWKFFLGGVFLKLVSLGNNLFFVEVLRLNKTNAYITLLGIDLILGFLIQYFFVFPGQKERSFKQLVLLFFAWGILFRGIDFLIYSMLLARASEFYLLAQLVSIGIVFALKYVLFKKIFR